MKWSRLATKNGKSTEKIIEELLNENAVNKIQMKLTAKIMTMVEWTILNKIRGKQIGLQKP